MHRGQAADGWRRRQAQSCRRDLLTAGGSPLPASNKSLPDDLPLPDEIRLATLEDVQGMLGELARGLWLHQISAAEARALLSVMEGRVSLGFALTAPNGQPRKSDGEELMERIEAGVRKHVITVQQRLAQGKWVGAPLPQGEQFELFWNDPWFLRSMGLSRATTVRGA